MLLTGLLWLVFIAALAGVDVWLDLTGRPTLSEWVRKQDRRYPWFRYVVIGALIILCYHFFS
jgi:hypothetical protein